MWISGSDLQVRFNKLKGFPKMQLSDIKVVVHSVNGTFFFFKHMYDFYDMLKFSFLYW